MKLSISFVLLFALLAIAVALPTGKMPRKMRLKSLRAKTGGDVCTDYHASATVCPVTIGLATGEATCCADGPDEFDAEACVQKKNLVAPATCDFPGTGIALTLVEYQNALAEADEGR